MKSRKNIAAIDLDTNSLVDWRPLANGSVQSMEIVADTVYLGGSFSAIGGTFDPAYQVGNSAIQYDYVSGGTGRRYLAAVDKSTAELRAWNPSAGATVTSLESSSGTLYAGGDFSYIGSFPGTTRNSLAAFDVATGSLSSWNPGASGQSSTSSSATKIYSLLLSGSDLIVGGSFSTLNGVARSGYGVLDGATNAIVGGNPTAPANTAVPTISGTVNTGETLTASQGTWSGSPSAFRYEWMKSSLTGGTYAPIADATTNSYVVTDADIGRRISVTVTAASSGGATAAQSATTIIVPVPVPKNAVIPTVGGNAVVDSLLSAQAGVWDYGATSYKYQWKQSATVDGTYVNITGAQAPTFALSINDLGTYVKVAVIANNSVGDSLPVESLPTARVTDLVPVNVATPEATGIAQTNQILSVSTGVWNNRPTSFAYQWKRSATVDGTYENIAGAEANTYAVTADDVGYFIKGSVAGVNSGGTSAYSLSGPTVKAIDIAPVYAGPPVITGTVQTDQILSVSTGVWNNRPTSFTYQWKRSATVDGAYVNIASAEANTYVVSVNDLGYFFQAVVTGINTGGTAVASAWSGVTIASVDLVPTSSTIPVVTGTTQTEQVLSVSDGVWANRPTLLTYRWQRSATVDGTYVNIAGAETNTYVVSAGDVGYFIKGTVSGSNTGGASLYASSVATSQVIDLKPISSISPAITGVSQTDRTLSVSNGSWNNRPTSFTYQWMRSTSSNGSYTDVANANTATYFVATSDVGYFFKARVKGVNSGGEAITAATSEATASTIDIAPTNSVAPTISGVVQSGRTLTASTGTWTNRPTLFTYQWRRSLTNSGFVDIDGANSNTYELDEGDVGYRFKVSVIASNTGGVAAAEWSTMTAAVLDVAPVVVSAPSVSGTGQVGQRLTASTGSWRSSPTSYTYQWKRASTANGNYASIGSETSNTYDITVDDVGQYIKVAVIATNDIGSSVASLSAARGPLIDIIATNVSAPIASGILRNGEELSASTGQWNSSPSSYTYQWKRSSSATGSFTNISGATNATFALTDDDIDQFIKVAVVAVNSGGSSSAELSATVGPVADLPTVPAPTVSQLSIKSLSAGFTFQVSNYSSTYTYALTASSGSAAMNDTGLVTVKGLDAGSSASITVRSSRTGYRSASLVVQGETTAPPATTTTTVQAATTTAPTNAGPNTTTTSTTTTTTIAPRLTSAVSVAPAKTSTSKTAPSTTIAVVSGLTQGQTQSAGKGATTQSTMTTQPGVTTTTVPAPVVEQVQPGAGVATINGEVVEVELTRVDNQVVVTSGGLSAAVGVLNPDGSVAPLDDKGNVRVKPGQLFSTELGGFVAGTKVEVWMYSTPHLLGSMITDANGKVRATFELPAGLESGDHRLAFVGTGPDGKESTIVIGVVAGAVPKKVSSMKILIAIPILLAILIGLMLPGVLRRRRTEG